MACLCWVVCIPLPCESSRTRPSKVNLRQALDLIHARSSRVLTEADVTYCQATLQCAASSTRREAYLHSIHQTCLHSTAAAGAGRHPALQRSRGRLLMASTCSLQ